VAGGPVADACRSSRLSAQGQLVGNGLLAAALTMLAATIAIVFTPPPSLSGPAAAADVGYRMFTPRTGIVPTGLDVWVVPGRHVTVDVRLTRYAVDRLRAQQLPIRFLGISAHPSRRHTVIVAERSTVLDGGAGYGGFSSTSKAGYTVVTSGYVHISMRRGYGMPTVAERNLWLHEFGHVVGLDHYMTGYNGRTQVMYPLVLPIGDYQAGDINGLRAVAADTDAIRLLTRPNQW
jgi:hypothetical protein